MNKIFGGKNKMAKFKNVAMFVLAALMLFGVCAISAGCSDSDKIKELQKQITELDNHIEKKDCKIVEMEKEMENQDKKNIELKNEIDEQNGRINGLQKQINQLTEIIKDFVDTTSMSGFFTLHQAYYYGLLSEADLQTIANCHNNGIPYPENIGEDIAKSLKKVWAKNLSESEKDTSSDLTEEDVSIVKYYGNYNNCVIVIVEKKGSTYIDIYAPYSVEIGNVIFNYNYPRPEIIVYKY